MSLYGTCDIFLIWDHMGPQLSQGSARLAVTILSILEVIVGL